MEKQFLMEDETILVQSDDLSVVLTNRRLLKNVDISADAYFISMQLQNISTIEIHSKSFPWLLIFGIICGISSPFVGEGVRDQGAMILCLAIAIILILSYFFTRYHVVNVASNGGSRLYFRTKGMKRETVLDLVRKIDQAKSLIK